MGEIANQMVLELICRIREKIREKKKEQGGNGDKIEETSEKNQDQGK